MKKARVFMLVLAFLAAGAVAIHCGDDDGNTDECTPACETGYVCVGGVCRAVGADADADGEVVDDVPVEVEPDVTDVPAEVEPDVPPDVGPEVEPDVVPDGDGGELRNTGEPCTSNEDCTGPGANCLTSLTLPVIGAVAFPGGYCSSTCGAGGACGPDGYCLDASAFGGPTGCVLDCETNADCRESEGYICSNFAIMPETFCAPPVSMGG